MYLDNFNLEYYYQKNFTVRLSYFNDVFVNCVCNLDIVFIDYFAGIIVCKF